MLAQPQLSVSALTVSISGSAPVTVSVSGSGPDKGAAALWRLSGVSLRADLRLRPPRLVDPRGDQGLPHLGARELLPAVA